MRLDNQVAGLLEELTLFCPEFDIRPEIIADLHHRALELRKARQEQTAPERLGGSDLGHQP